MVIGIVCVDVNNARAQPFYLYASPYLWRSPREDIDTSPFGEGERYLGFVSYAVNFGQLLADREASETLSRTDYASSRKADR
jgi:hypothetical protein